MMAEPADPRLGTEIAGYRIEERIGRGGMGVVYRAQHMNLQRRAAIKIIAPEFADTKGFRTRFIREARIAAALQHPNIVTVYDAGQSGETLYIAMQFIRGSDLGAILREEGRLRPYRAIDVCRQIASALDAAHGMALIHRDVKPGNVLIEGRRAYLTDFGLTKRSGDERQRPDPGRRARGDDPLHRARADRGRPGRRPHRRLLARVPALPLPRRRRPVLARHRRRRDLRAPLGDAAEALGAAPGAARWGSTR